MENNVVTISGMFGADRTYFSDSPVIIAVSGLFWGQVVTSPFTIVHLDVLHNGQTVGSFVVDTGGQTHISFNISSALHAIWSEYDFSDEVQAAMAAVTTGNEQSYNRQAKEYSIRVSTEYLASDDGGVFVRTECEDEYGNKIIPAGKCIMGGLSEWERSLIGTEQDADVSHLEHTGVRNGDASTKPTSTPEIVGRDSITSWVDLQQGVTKSIFYPADADMLDDDVINSVIGWTGHAPIVLRDSIPYTDFLFVNSRGAIETCSAKMLDSMGITVKTKQYTRTDKSSFKPSRTVAAITSGGRRSWSMSSGYQTREWLEWWTMEFMLARQRWMLYKGIYVPVVVEPDKNEINIYDRSKQQLGSIDFTVTMALEG